MRRILAIAIAMLAMASGANAADPDPKDWKAVTEAARGQTVYWNAWGGDPRINDFIAWAGDRVETEYGVSVVQVKLNDTAEAVSRVVAEKAAGTVSGGSVDLIWINGENFASMKRNGLLFGPWSEDIPNFSLTRPDENPGVREDFTVPVDGLEAPWGKAQIVFYHDTELLPEPPKNLSAMLEWAKANPGRLSYPLPPDFIGSTFLKQVLLTLAEDTSPLYRPVEEETFDRVTAPLWNWLDAIHPHLFRQARSFPTNGTEMRNLVADGELSIGFTFDPADASSAIASGELPDTVRTYVLEGGTIGNVHFVAIPFNAAHKEGAMVLANFLLSPEAQARKQDPAVWGSATVLAVDSLAPTDKALFDALDLGIATLKPEELGRFLPEPHPSWMERIEMEWAERYTRK
jgi:putative thiamine transport system substrate-binding protein